MLKINQNLLSHKLPMMAVLRLQSTLSKEKPEARPFEEIPKMSTWYFVRSMLPGGKYYKKDMKYMMLTMQKEFGSIFLVPAMMGRPQVLTTHNPNDFEVVYRNEGVWPQRPGSDSLRYHRQKHGADFFQGIEGLITTQDKVWGDFRSKVNPIMMQPKNVRLYLHKMSQINKEFVECIKRIRDPQTLETPANFEDFINRWTLESVSVVALDKQLGLLKDKDVSNSEVNLLFNSLNDFFQYTFEIEMKPSPWRWISTPNFKKLMNALDNIKTITSGFVNEAIERLSEEEKRGITRPESQQSVLEKLLKVDKKVAIVMAMDMLMAGVDTTTSTFTGLLLNIAKNPEKQAKLREEVLQVLPKKDSEFTEESLKSLPYLRACIKESLRIYPLVLGQGRVTTNDVVLSGYHIPKGMFVSMIPLSLHNNEKYYARPNEFLPERWIRNDKSTETQGKCPVNELKATNPFVYLPFGFGPRVCIGKRIVDLELELGLARIIRNFQVEFNYPTENAFKSYFINMPNIPLQFKFTDIV